MINRAEIEKGLGIKIPVSADMEQALQLWCDMYEDKAYWLKDDIVSLELASEIAAETARLVTNNGRSWISGSDRADFLQQQYSAYMQNIRRDVEFACALGGIAFKPFLSGKKVRIDAIAADRFYPVNFDSDGELLSAVFEERHIIGRNVYTRLEFHEHKPDSGDYLVQNHAFVSNDIHSLGKECRLSDIEMWRSYTENMHIRDIEKPLFVYFRMPSANNIDRMSPLGVSCYSKAAEQIRQADEHWALTMWEFNGSQLAIDAPSNMFLKKNGKIQLPQRMQRLFRTAEYDASGKDIPIKEFSPAIRDASLFNGFNRILQRIEFNCDLAYGTLSDPQTVEKTAEEVRAGKERSRVSMEEKQKALEGALKHLVWIMNEYADFYKLAPPGKYEMTFEWGDGAAEDREKEFARRMQLASAGKLKWEKLLAWYFRCSEEKAAEYIPAIPDLFGGDA